MENLSSVVRRFGTKGDDAPTFVAKWIPRDWKPQIVIYGLWDSNESRKHVQGQNIRVVKLNAFPSQVFAKAFRFQNARSRAIGKRIYKGLRDKVLRWLYKLEDAGEVRSFSSGGQMNKGVGCWTWHYKSGSTLGAYTATIIATGRNSAILHMHLSESSARISSPRELWRKG